MPTAARSGFQVAKVHEVLKRVLVGLVVALTLSACAARPTEEELTSAILAATAEEAEIEISQAVAACIARELLATDLSDTTLAGLAEDFDAPEVLETELDAIEPLVTEAATTCQSAT